ncbi:MAG: hypothetical protein AABX47_02480, partial [Nanoarchaeota archaeon]
MIIESSLIKLKPWEEFTPLFRITGADFSGSKFSYTAQDYPTNNRLKRTLHNSSSGLIVIPSFI